MRAGPRARADDRGSSTVEFVIGTAVMVTMLTVIVQFALYFHIRTVANTAARHGLDHVRVVDGSVEDGVATASEFLDQSGRSLEGRQVSAERGASTSSVTVTGDVVSVVPGLNLRVEVTVDAPTERLTP